MYELDVCSLKGGNQLIKIPSTAKGPARLATPEEIAREQTEYYLANDSKDYLQSDVLDFLVPNVPEFGYTNPNLHRRINLEAGAPTDDRPFPFVADLVSQNDANVVTEDSDNVLAPSYGNRTEMENYEGTPDYPLEYYDAQGNPYRQSIKLGVWDGVHSYRTTTIYTHDEESTTCEIP